MPELVYQKGRSLLGPHAMDDEATARRKQAHLDVCATEEVEPKENRTLLDCVQLVHCALPELALDDIDLGAELVGRRLAAPLVITGMTGGTPRAESINRDLAALAQKHGLAFGVGSQRAMDEDPSQARTFQVRDVAPTAVLLGNVGLAQAAGLGPEGVRALMAAIGADGMALHLNAAQELTQPEGDRSFRGGEATVARLAKALGDKLVVKETGCGIGPDVARRLVAAGVRTLDISGLGGTSWVRVEQLRTQDRVAAEIGKSFAGWGIPTAAAVLWGRQAAGPDVRLVASGGIRTGLDVAKALALGADVAGMALPLFRAHQTGGMAGAEEALLAVLGGLRQALLLTGSRDVRALKSAKKVVLGDLKDWAAAL